MGEWLSALTPGSEGNLTSTLNRCMGLGLKGRVIVEEFQFTIYGHGGAVG